MESKISHCAEQRPEHDEFVAFALVEVARATHHARGRILHAGSFCPENYKDALSCHVCAEVIHDVILILLPKGQKFLTMYPKKTLVNLKNWVVTNARVQLHEVIRRRRNDRGALVRVARAVSECRWIADLFNDQEDVLILESMLFRAGSEEAQFCESQYPTATWATKFGMEEADLTVTIARIERTVREIEPARYEKYLGKPFDRGLIGRDPVDAAGNSVVESVEGSGPDPGGDDQVDHWLVQALVGLVVKNLATGIDCDAAARLALKSLGIFPVDLEMAVQILIAECESRASSTLPIPVATCR